MSLQKRCVSKIMDNDGNCDDIISSCDVKTRLQIVKSLDKYIMKKDLKCSGWDHSRSFGCGYAVCNDCGYRYVSHGECSYINDEYGSCEFECYSCNEFTMCRNCLTNRKHKHLCNSCFSDFLKDDEYICHECSTSFTFCKLCYSTIICEHNMYYNDEYGNVCIVCRG